MTQRVALLFALFSFFFLPVSQAVTCGTRCEPTSSGSGYSGTVAARPQPNNERGDSAPAPQAGPVLLGSESYNYAVPLLSLPGRNGLDLNLTLYYNSRVWTISTSSSAATFNGDRDFPSYGFRLGYGYLELSGTTAVLTEADGSKRNLVQLSTSTYEADDASYIRYLATPKTLYYKNGTQVLYEFFPGSTTLLRPIKILDTNGNFISVSYRADTWAKGQDIATITDAVGRVVTFNYDAGGLLSSITQGAKTFTFTWNTGYVLTYSFSISVTNSPASGSTHNVLTGVTLPNGVRFSFLYGDWGIVNRIEGRSSTGALRSYTSYNYPAGTVAQPGHPTFTQRTLFDGLNTAVWTYATTKSGAYVSSSTVTDPAGTKTVSNLFTSGNFLGLSSTVEIRDASDTVLRAASYTWLADSSNRNARLQTLVSTLSDSGQQSTVVYTYDAYGNVTELKEYDFGLGLKRQTSTTYLSSSPYLTARILNRPAQVLVKDAAGATVAKTTLAYDATSLTGVSGAAQHDDTNYSATYLTRGNLTSVTRYTNAAASAGPTTRNFYYDTLGNLRTAELDCCNQKQWGYTAATQYSLPETITRGPVGTQLTTSATYNLATGTVATSTDENGKTTSYQYDALDRPTQVTLPDGTASTASFDDAGALPAVTQSSTANNLVQVVTLDGLGRPVEREARDGATSVSTVETFYDAVGRPAQSSNPYGPAETAQWTTTSYDALGRPTLVTPPGNAGSYQYEYAGASVTVTDPAGKQRRSTTDALGRLVQVDEPGWGGLPGSGSVTISGSDRSRYACWEDPEIPNHTFCGTVYDFGTVSITVNGLTKSADYNGASTPSTLAAALASAFNADAASPAWAGASGATVYLTAKGGGLATNYSLSVGGATDSPYFTGKSFTLTPSGATLTGAEDPTTAELATLARPMRATYQYDPLDDLVLSKQGEMDPVSQLPGQQRTYTYDSLGRVLTAATPESGTVTYTYTDFGAVATRQDARGVVTTYSYDGLHRLTSASYNVGATGVPATSSVTYTYGANSAPNNNGRLVTVADGTNTETYTYDLLGRVTNAAKVIGGTSYTVGYGYNLASEVTSLSYPSGRVVNQMYDPIGRLTQLLAAGQPPYLSVASADYSAAGQVKHALYGNGVAGDFSYNERLQLASLRYSKPGSPDLLNLGYEYGTQNNGQMQKVRYYTSPGVEDLTKTQSYEYDAWAHLKRAYTTDLTQPGTWRLEWGYDRLGNRRNQSLTGGNTAITQPQLTISETTNRITTAGFAYDAAGNMTNDSLHSYTYDAEGRMTKVDNGTTATYSYVGASRVKKVAGSTTTVYIYSGSKVIAEYVNGALSKEYVYSGSSLLATLNPDGSVASYEHPDHLSTRVETDAAGVVTRTFGQYPFGEVWYETGTASKWKFTSYERDGESGLDYAVYRYDSSRLGRFMSPDPLAGSISNPQSLNRYTYVGNDPVNGVDPLGLKRPRGEADEFRGAGGAAIYAALSGGGFGISNCNLDGINTPCGSVYAALRSGGAVQCPNNVCGGVTSDGRPVQFRAPTVGPGGYWALVWVPSSSTGFDATNPDTGLAQMTQTIAHWELRPIGSATGSVGTASWVSSWGERLLNYIKTHAVGISFSEIIAVQAFYQHSTRTACGGLGVGASVLPTKAVTLSILNEGNMNRWTEVMSGPSWTFGANIYPGYQAMWSAWTPSPPTVGGPSVSTGIGVGGSYTFGGCTTIP